MTFEGLIEVAVGLTLVYSLLAVLASGFSEVTESIVRRRPRYLEAGILDLLGGTVYGFYEHPLVQTLHPDRGRPRRIPKQGEPLPDHRKQKPSYIPSRIFSATLLALLTDNQAVVQKPADGTAIPPGTLTPEEAVERLEQNLTTLEDGQLKRCVTAFLASSGRDLHDLRAELERWYDDKMDRVSGWYKRRTRMVLLIWGVLIAVAFNADTIVLAKTLYASSTLRASLAAAAQNGSIVSTGQPCPADARKHRAAAPPASLECVAEQMHSIEALRTPLGWSTDGPAWPRGRYALLLKALGLLATALALTLGAPFWFDLFNKFVNVRSTGQPPPKHAEPSRATQPPPGIGEAGAARG